MLKRRQVLTSSTALALAALPFMPARAQRIADTFVASFDPLRTPVPPVLDASKGEKSEVRQFFAYWCPHCSNLEPAFLKWEKSAQGAIAQIKDRHYTDALKEYRGNLLLAGINYNRETKTHTCVIEQLTKED